MRTYLSTLGYHETRLTRPILKHGIDEGDEVVVVRPDQDGTDDRAAEALDSVEAFVSEIEPNVCFTVEGVPTDDFGGALIACSDVLRAAEGTVVVNFGGGAREVLLPLATATLAHVECVESVLNFGDTDHAVHEWTLPDLTANPPAKTLDTLQLLATVEEPVSISELAEQSAVAKSTVGRHISQLAEAGAVNTEQTGKTKQVELTLTGEMLLRTQTESL
ncbi:CRISPR-associated CARF protein Csa3 [Halorussus pelagicus]|uniref:CRISPR-associated CARF protein Csa3 n=1 Tax=Halorussus pelagicus TaxID=2505977 RepID=UPI000FFC1567|nr:CRISPR-associated CARF protein Csa3 [Halorussus pelagicus]